MSHVANIIRDAISTQLFPVINLYIISSHQQYFMKIGSSKQLSSLAITNRDCIYEQNQEYCICFQQRTFELERYKFYQIQIRLTMNSDGSVPVPKKKEKHQIKALLLKNLHLQKRQPFTNCCQIITPIICLILTILIRNAAIDNIPTQNDTIYAALPLISTKFNDYYISDQIEEVVYREKEQWLVFDCEDPSDLEFVGGRDGYHNKGMLGKISSTYRFPLYFNNSINEGKPGMTGYSPVFVRPNQSIAEELFRRYQFLNEDTFYSLMHTRTAQHLPDGAVYFRRANKSRLEAVIRAKDVREFLFYRPNGMAEIRMKIDANSSTKFNSYFIIPEGFLTVMDMISKAYIKETTGKTITSGYTYLPFTSEGSVFIDMLINTIATIIFPLALSLLLPVFLYLVVLQKEEKLIQMMRMNGMSMTNYWSINFLYNLIISLATNLVFYLFGYFFLDISFFRQTSFWVLAVVYLGWILAQIGLSVFLQVFLSSSRAANIIGYLVAIWTNLIGATLSIAMFQFPIEQPIGFTLWPTFAFTRVYYLLFTYCGMDQCLSGLSSLTDEMVTCIVVLYVSAGIFMLLGMYLFEVIPQQFGVTRPLLFPLHFCLDCFRSKEKKSLKEKYDQDAITNADATIDQEIDKIKEVDEYRNFPLVVKNLSKRYDNGKLAVDQLNLMVEDKTIFGLLGPNGAGKTTLLSMITGIFGPTGGNAFVGGYSIKDQIDKVHLEMGVCPQFDILWPTLTVEEHLYFYARLRGVSRKDEDQKVNSTLEEVNLEEWRKSKAMQLSGGMKRRLSIGISLVGDPRIVFMDEPTTGLDPENRRHLWEVLSSCRAKRAIFLTTHQMEEAQSLCDRVGIITTGSLRTVGDQFRLKQLYGKGYFITISVDLNKEHSKIFALNINSGQNFNINEEIQYQQASSGSFRVKTQSVMTEKEQEEQIFMRNQLQVQAKLRDSLLKQFAPASIVKEIGGLVKICVSQNRVSVILQELRQLKERENANFEWAISESTLEDVFLEVVNRYDRQAKESLLDSQAN